MIKFIEFGFLSYLHVQNDFRRENDRSFAEEKSQRGRRRPDEKRRAERKIEEGRRRGGADGGERGRRR